ncbi:MAG: glycoside hydrolase family 3 N-terminal domain-containing protein [Gammaproteobacteria bacterium]
MNSTGATSTAGEDSTTQRVRELLSKMTLAEKIGQMNQLHAGEGYAPDYLAEGLRAGHIGAVLNVVDVNAVNELQRIAHEESRLGIPLLVGRDVIHGFKTIFPIPLGQAATWNPELVRKGARIAAREAATTGVNWTFAPMVDISRDARWGRIAESFGEDVYLAGRFAAAMVEGFQGDALTNNGSIASCVKHFAGYGAAESGRDYATTNIPENELRNVYLPPFKSGIDAGALTLMTSFSDLNGVPATGNEFLLRNVLRDEWQFDGVVVSDWDSVRQLQIHGLTENAKESAFVALKAGVDMEMSGDAYSGHLETLIEEGRVDIAQLDTAVSRILLSKFRLGLFDNPYTQSESLPPLLDEHALEAAKEAALQSVVMLKNHDDVLPLDKTSLQSVAVIGPLSNAPYEQLGTWVFDGNPEHTVTPLRALQDALGEETVKFEQAMANSRSKYSETFERAAEVARACDVALLFLGEESILSGEAHSRADISLPGDQLALVQKVKATETPVVAVVLAGRPLTLTNLVDHVDAILFAWHPGTMGGPAIADLLLGVSSPSGKLPATFPKMVGQIPIYYNQKPTGKPPTPDTVVHIDDIDTHAPQTSLGMTAFHLDAGYLPLFPFGFGLSYTRFEYSDLTLSSSEISMSDVVEVSAKLMNAGNVAADEIVQLYVRDLVGQVTRPLKELKGFRRVHVLPGQTLEVSFKLQAEDLAFYGLNMKRVTEPGRFHVWVGGSSATELRTELYLTK